MAVSSSIGAAQCVVAGFDETESGAVSCAGGKGASLSRMTRAGLPVPPGFVVCAEAFREFLRVHNGGELIVKAVAGLDVHDDRALASSASLLREFIVGQPMPASLDEPIRAAFEHLSSAAHNLKVAVRSSAVSEDGEAASFAGQQETFLNLRDPQTVVQKVKECWASFFSGRSLFYRAQKGDLTDANIAVVIQQMVFAEKSGVLFTMDPVQNRPDYMVIEAVWGLGEGIVSGAITPDQYVLDRDDGSLFHDFVAVQSSAIVHDPRGEGILHIDLEEEKGVRRVLNEQELNDLWKLGLQVESFFGKPQDIEWAMENNRLHLLQSRPVTTLGAGVRI